MQNPHLVEPIVDSLEALGLIKFEEPQPRQPVTHWVPIIGTMSMGDRADADRNVKCKVKREAICREDDLIAVLRQAGFTVTDCRAPVQPVPCGTLDVGHKAYAVLENTIHQGMRPANDWPSQVIADHAVADLKAAGFQIVQI